jgi:hypothetical protein
VDYAKLLIFYTMGEILNPSASRAAQPDSLELSPSLKLWEMHFRLVEALWPEKSGGVIG